MRVFFVTNDNAETINDYVEDIYDVTINTFEKAKCGVYDTEEDLQVFKEIETMIEMMKNVETRKFYNNLILGALKNIRYVNVSKHLDKCVVRGVFDIIFKYCFDFEYRIVHLCCNTISFKTMQYEILNDLRWKII